MKRKIIGIINILLLVSVSLTRSFAQEGIVRYKYILNVDTTISIKNVEGVPAFLYFSPGRSLFVFDRFRDTLYIEHHDQEEIPHDGSVLNLDERDEYGDMFYKNFISSKLLMRRFLFKEAFIAEEPLPAVHWTILTDTQKIGGFTCRKAIADFRGRIYEAWFAPGIPVKDGPWKLDGLPGLILEAYDKNREIQYLFDSIQLPYPSTNDITEPKDGTHLSLEAFKNIEQTQADKMVKMVKAFIDRKDEVDIKIEIFPIEKNYD